MKGAVLSVLCAIALSQGAVLVNENGCPTDYSVESFLPHANCGQFYQCVHGKLVERSCSPGLHFNPELNLCDFPASGNCQNQDIENENPKEDSNENENIVEEQEGAGNDDPSQASAICAEEGSNGVLVAHEHCNRFYMCSFGVPVAIKCPGELLYDPSKERCEWPDTVNCGDRVISNSDEETDHSAEDNTGNNDQGGNNDQNSDDDAPSGNNNNDPSQASRICSAADSSGVLVAHENCNQFYLCTFGLPVAQSCPGDLLFDPSKDRCEWPDTVDCGNRVIPEKDDNNNEGSATEGNGPGNDDPSLAPAICAAEGSDHSYVAHEICNKFYQCWAGIPVALPCPAGFLFNPKKEYCDFPQNVDCGDREIVDLDDNNTDNNNPGGSGDGNSGDDAPSGNNNNDPSQASRICSAADSSGVLVAHENCNQFYLCTFGLPVAQSCPGDLLFDPSKDRCEWPDTVDCGNRVIPEKDDNNNEGSITESNGPGNDDPSLAPSICAAEGSDHSYVAHEICNKFYQCWAGTPVALPCPAGFLFNPKKEYCDFPQNVDCGNREIVDIDDNNTDNNNPGGNDNGNSEDDAPNGNNYDDPSQAPQICSAEGSSGVLVAHENCNQFYQCAFGLPVAQSCPGDLLFDPSNDRCEWPDTVDCGSRVIPEKDDNSNEGSISDGNGVVNEDPSQAPAICAVAGSDGIYVAHQICNKFYQCWAGKPVAVFCATGTLFNPRLNVCDFPHNVACGNRLIPAVLA